ncbi:hypothetical protein PR048_008910 [Dryococelus australis]|uniref:Uncharacterized protein n=1 Tax=Dryococelus australis TaxID=614101 RepID=A0ABQ9HYF4_9NEOP|nr:hypothetical protein PR048_008910 [Dryococelus australis]
MDQHWNARVGEMVDPRENPSTCGTIPTCENPRIEELDSKIPAEFQKYTEHGFFTIERNQMWSGVRSDMPIEENPSHPMTVQSGLTHGRGTSTSALAYRFGRLLTARSGEPMGVIEVNMERRWNEGVRATRYPRENPPTNGIVRHDSHLRKSEQETRVSDSELNRRPGSASQVTRISDPEQESRTQTLRT